MRIVIALLLLFFVAGAGTAIGQGILLTRVTIEADHRPVSEILKQAEQQGHFYFSYNNRVINDDSLVSVSIRNKPLKTLLDAIWGNAYQYIESNNHLIIQPNVSAGYWYVSGYVVDVNSGEPVAFASVFEQQQLTSTMTDERGYFRLQLKEKRPQSSISIRKLSYKDTVVLMSDIKPDNLRISIQPTAYALDSVVISGVEKNWLAGAFISSQQAMNSLNLNHFFTRQPFQFSLTPGLGTHGSMGSQVINKFSLNLLGGYTAGVKGLEIGGLFNIVKGNMKYVQLAGLFNVVGGEIQGVQVAGLYNSGLKNFKGFQAAGLANVVLKDVTGAQMAGWYNYSTNMTGLQVSGIGSLNIGSGKGAVLAGTFNIGRDMTGLQVAGSLNVNVGKTKGVQLAGITNFSMREMNGLQIAGLLNYTRKLTGVQIGVVNIVDSTEGYSIGLLNVSVHGYHKISVSTSEWQQLSVAYKSGNAKLYSMLIAGTQLDPHRKAYSYGYGMGSDCRMGHKGFYINPEVSAQYVYNGNLDNRNQLFRLQVHMKYKLGRYAFVYAGPAFSVLYSRQVKATEGYQSDLTNGYPSFSMGKYVTGWFGWSAGIDLF